jgi:FlaA1/EpsC-like NDP-sugar epimerase
MTRTVERVIGGLYRFRLTVLLVLHIGLIVIANQAAFWLRFDGATPLQQQPFERTLLPLLILIRLATFVPLRLHEGVWRYASIWDLRNIVIGVLFSTVVFWLVIHGVMQLGSYPRSVIIIDSVLLICLMGGVRLGRRFHAATFARSGARRVLIYGAGDAGEMIARDMLLHTTFNSVPVGFLDDDPGKIGGKIHGIPVVGGGDSVKDIVAAFQPDEILVAMPSAEPRALRKIVAAMQAVNLPIKTLPGLRQIPSGRVSLNEVRDLSVADLLTRAPVGLDPQRVRSLINGQVVLVTGAGGSIGGELCRQILPLGPKRLVMLDRYENGLFAIHREAVERWPHVPISDVIADITDAARLDQVFSLHPPTVVFHAAAHKHVPLMEANPCEAVKNNLRGTRLLADACVRWATARFVLISTDKAVNPTSVMGATKRAAEMLVQHYALRHNTVFSVVRFGNVLGSNGSVVPTFLEQIKNGGPVTVTHPEMRRYFMLIPEAVLLVMHAAAIGEQGGIYVLDMGEQVRVLDMARDLIRLAGYIPDKDIEIVFSGTRPGEKLFEELVGRDERSEPSSVDKVSRVRTQDDSRDLTEALQRLEQCAIDGDAAAVAAMLHDLVPHLNPVMIRSSRNPASA